jgi:RimJ/RimL family protein N-acetyltransferase
MLPFPLRAHLQTPTARLLPLQAADFADLYAVAADPLIWAQHPNQDRWRPDVFATYFEGALRSGGAFRIVDQATGATLGSTRLYDYEAQDGSLLIGYTFFGRQSWGTGLNLAVKAVLLEYAFAFVDTVRFHIGAHNVRSQIAIQRLGARKVAEQEVAYYGEPPQLNFVYAVDKSSWREPGVSGQAKQE